MHSIESGRPTPPLRKYVRAYAQRRINRTDPAPIARVPARLEQILEFEFDESFEIHFDNGPCITSPRISVIGPQTHLRATVAFVQGVESFGVFFQPSGFSQLFGVPMRVLANFGCEATSILGAHISGLWNSLGEVTTFTGRVAIVERFLLDIAKRETRHDRMTDTANRLLAIQGRVSISDVARSEGMSLRHFERRFTEQVGISPKMYARIARFQTALDLKVLSPWMTWLEISHSLGYHDQMHMIHDFKSLGGDVPTRVLEFLGDMRPEALASSFLEESESCRIFTMRRSKAGLILPAT
jgi:AraC-like DNA-binding protein